MMVVIKEGWLEMVGEQGVLEEMICCAFCK